MTEEILASPRRVDDKSIQIPLPDPSLPAICCRCSTRQNVSHQKKKFQWAPPWTVIFLVACGMIGVILYLVQLKRATLQLPFCGECAQIEKKARLIGLGLVLLFLGGIIGGMLAIGNDLALLGIPLILIGVGALVVGVIKNRGKFIMVKKMTKTSITLTNLHTDAISAMQTGDANIFA